MLLALKSIDATYPITSFFGDIGHPRASNKPDEIQYVFDLIKPWLAYYLKSVGEPPTPSVYAARTHARNEAFDTDVLRVANWSDLWTAVRSKEWAGDPPNVLVNPVTYAQSGTTWDPLVMEGAEQLRPYTETPPAPVILPGTLQTFTVSASELSGGGDLTIVGQPVVTLQAAVVGHRVQLNVRLIDVDGSSETLITRGTLTLDAGTGVEIGARELVIPTYGNYWRVGATHTMRLEVSNVDAPYITPSREPSSTVITSAKLEVPIR
jgi:hypothetical protein